MKENPSKYKTEKTRWMMVPAIQDIITTCPKCGGEVGLWSEENETLCIFCDHKVFEKENTIH